MQILINFFLNINFICLLIDENLTEKSNFSINY